MPVDRLRIAGPSETKSPLLFVQQKVTRTLLNEEGKRSDGTSCLDVRPVFLKAGVVTQAKGSCYMELSKTKVMCTVYGPREIPRKRDFSMTGLLSCEFKYAPFSCTFRRQHQQDKQEKDMSVMLQQALEPVICLYEFPKAQVDVYVMVLENDGGVMSAAITAAGVALADAGILMYDIVVAASLRQMGEEFLMDPTEEEVYKAHLYSTAANSQGNSSNQGNVFLSLMPNTQQISAYHQDGDMDIESVAKASKQLMTTCQKMVPVVRQCLEKMVRKKMKKISITDNDMSKG